MKKNLSTNDLNRLKVAQTKVDACIKRGVRSGEITEFLGYVKIISDALKVYQAGSMDCTKCDRVKPSEFDFTEKKDD